MAGVPRGSLAPAPRSVPAHCQSATRQIGRVSRVSCTLAVSAASAAATAPPRRPEARQTSAALTDTLSGTRSSSMPDRPPPPSEPDLHHRRAGELRYCMQVDCWYFLSLCSSNHILESISSTALAFDMDRRPLQRLIRIRHGAVTLLHLPHPFLLAHGIQHPKESIGVLPDALPRHGVAVAGYPQGTHDPQFAQATGEGEEVLN
jgi:hypothetical protein